MADNETRIFKILGVKDDEIMILSKINDCTICGEKSGQIHAITMRTISEEQIERSWDEYELRDYWVQAVESNNTDESLSDWVESVKYKQNEKSKRFKSKKQTCHQMAFYKKQILQLYHARRLAGCQLL